MTKKVINFIVRSIICRYEIPHTIITDNGTQFDSVEFKKFCHMHCIEKRFAVVTHPQANRHVEAVNKVIKSILKKRPEKAKGKWVDELSLALWAYRTTNKSTSSRSLFALAYGSKAMILVELEVSSHWVIHYNLRTNKELLLESLDVINEKRDEADLRAAAHEDRSPYITTP